MNNKSPDFLENQISKIQKKYRSIKIKINKLDELISFQKDYLMSMINNLSFMNNLKIFQETNNLYTTILHKLDIIKKQIDEYSLIITIKNYTINKTKHDEITNLIIEYSNYITSENIIPILHLLIGENWTKYFKKIDLEKIFFINKFVKPISVWECEYHKQEKDSPILYKNDEIYKNTSNSTKDVVESLLNIIGGIQSKCSIFL
jgi:hypothetical protein